MSLFRVFCFYLIRVTHEEFLCCNVCCFTAQCPWTNKAAGGRKTILQAAAAEAAAAQAAAAATLAQQRGLLPTATSKCRMKNLSPTRGTRARHRPSLRSLNEAHTPIDRRQLPCLPVSKNDFVTRGRGRTPPFFPPFSPSSAGGASHCVRDSLAARFPITLPILSLFLRVSP